MKTVKKLFFFCELLKTSDLSDNENFLYSPGEQRRLRSQKNDPKAPWLMTPKITFKYFSFGKTASLPPSLNFYILLLLSKSPGIYRAT